MIGGGGSGWIVERINFGGVSNLHAKLCAFAAQLGTESSSSCNDESVIKSKIKPISLRDKRPNSGDFDIIFWAAAAAYIIVIISNPTGGHFFLS